MGNRWGLGQVPQPGMAPHLVVEYRYSLIPVPRGQPDP
jgi:hypothetical protein